MLTHLQTRPPDQAEIAALFDTVADGMRRAVRERDPGRVPTFQLMLAGPDRADVPPAPAYRPGLQREPEARIAAAAARLESSLDRIHDASGTFVCRTWGVLGGVLLEVALMADLHLMHGDGTLIPTGLFDSHVPRLNAWSRLMERAGAARTASLLLTQTRVTAPQALANGLCDAIHQESMQDAGAPGPSVARDPSREPVSGTALRLARELSERTTRAGGLTPRQARVLERAAFALAFSCGDPKEGIAAFFSGRPARFTIDDGGARNPDER